jgi:rhodanese-related sulfurtransferase
MIRDDIARALTCRSPRCSCHRLRSVHCPAHQDDRPSLSVDERDGQILVYCHAGCAQEAVLAALREQGLWPGGGLRRTRYEIRDPAGRLVAVHVRTDGPGGKRLWWELPDGTVGLRGLRVEDLPLYGVHELISSGSRQVVVVEGEKARDSLAPRCPIPVVATVCGASSTPSADSLRPIAGLGVWLWPDADRPGIEHMRRVGLRLLEIDPRTQLFWVTWKGAPAGGDAADYDGDVEALLRSATPWRPVHADQLVAESLLMDAIERVRVARTPAHVELAMQRLFDSWRRKSRGAHSRPPDAETVGNHLGAGLPPVWRHPPGLERARQS